MLPPSVPKGWPNSSAEALRKNPQRKVFLNSEGQQQNSFCGNAIKTSRYEIWNFFPMFLLEEFNPKVKIANCYFLIISGLQCIPAITNTGGYPTVLIPLTMVLLISGIFKVAEDVARHKADNQANCSKTEVLNRETKLFEAAYWSEIEVGDYVRVTARETVPADLLIVQVTPLTDNFGNQEEASACYVETKSLDGETNLKQKNVLPVFMGVQGISFPSDLFGVVEMEHPNQLIDSFSGVIELELPDAELEQRETFRRTPSADLKTKSVRAAIQPNNIILRGCVLRNTTWMIGLVLNTGKDVKIMQGSASSIPISKFSNLEQLATRQIFGVMIFLIALCFTGATAQAIFNSNYNVSESWYLNWAPFSVTQWIIQFFYLLLLHASFIPVSLYVSMAIIRFGQASFMNSDLDMYYERLGYPASVRSMMLSEELGQISHVFSDKTGTLTCNDMVFRKMSINGVSYGQGITEIGKAAWKLLEKSVPPEVLTAEEEAIKNAVPHVAFYDPLLVRDLAAIDETPYRKAGEENPNSLSPKASPRLTGRQKTPTKVILTSADQSKYIKTFCRFLSICHEAVPENLEDGSVKISAPNPDDEALVCAAAYFGFEFKDKKKNVAYVFEKETQRMLAIEVLFLIPFSSARKRMSIIIRDLDGKIKIITKGADTALLNRLDPTCDEELTRTTLADIERYSLEGLRCLLLASAELSEEKFRTWRRRYEKATTDLLEIEKKKNGEINDIDTFEDFIENGLFVVGATAIEDRLQDGVPDCIERLIDRSFFSMPIFIVGFIIFFRSGMKVWVLTGDKEGTAINIAVACNLLLPPQYMHHIVINKSTAPTKRHVFAMLTKEIMRMRKESSAREDTVNVSKMPTGFWEELANDPAVFPRALIIDGPSLLDIMTDRDTQFVLLKFSNLCKAVVCCRMSPEQKREVVQMVKNGVPGVRTLSVGDGANDVPMIKAAHVGVGIKGEEGVQAVNASDFAIAQFRFLGPLLLKHGRFNYSRMSNIICFMFYKNILMSSAMFFFNFFNGFSGYKFYNEAAIQFFNLFYTSVPILLYGVYDQDISASTAMAYPQTYVIGLKNKLFNTAFFWQWVGNAIFEAAVFSILPLFLLTNMDTVTSANLESSLQAGATCFTAVVIMANLKILLIQSRWHLLHVIVLLLSIGSWIGLAFAVNYILLVDFDFYYMWWWILHSGTFWLVLLFLVASIALKDTLLAAIKRHYFPHPHQLLQELETSSSMPLSENYGRTTYDKIENRSGPLPIYLVSREERKRRIVERRGIFKWMPVFFENDEVHGAWYFIAGSALSALIPCIPLFGLFMPILEVVDIVPLVEHAAAYSLVVFIGVVYTLGSFAYLRACTEPKMPPLFTWRHFGTDKLFAFWLFAIGTAPSIPVMIIYVIHNPSNKSFQLALAVCILVTIAMALLTIYCYPSPDGSHAQPKVFFANLLCVFKCRDSWYGRHLANDWLVGCWLLFFGILLGCVCGAILLAYYSYHGMAREIYDWSTGLFDLILFLIGTMYVLAGTYEKESELPSNNEKWMAGSVRVLSEEEGEDQGEEENVVARQLWKGKGEIENHEV